ncbi:MAG: molybdopterin cofactor-binding domain-containing protein [Xanthomonadales bacterium]|nr:molybdopterin cofactor-binding domain-containing protein [Xanthomonadales bacterium]
MKLTATISRRSFLVTSAMAGGGLAIGLRFPATGTVQASDAIPEVGVWVLIHPDDTVVVRIARSEMGQGTLTGLAQLVAEELECDWSKVTTEFPTPGQSARRGQPWGSFGTFGSYGIRQSHEYVRKGGAVARTLLLQAAAEQWGVAAAECTAANSIITHSGSNRTLSFGSVAEAASKLTAPEDVVLKDPADWKVIGQPLLRLDTRDKVLGKQVYGADIQLPGMLNAAVKACPVFGGKLISFDASQISGLSAVRKVLTVGDNAVAVVADTWWQAKTALDKLDIQWDEGPNAQVSSASIAAMLAEGLTADDSFVANSNGDAAASIAKAAKKIEATYSYPFQNHATMEPMNATVQYTTESCVAWVPTQDGEAAFNEVVKVTGLAPEQCEVHKLILGGGFGRRTGYQDDFLKQAVQIAMQVPGTPVKMLWSREEDMTQGRYHPIMQCKLTGALNDLGELDGLQMRLSGQSILAGARPDLLARFGGNDPVVFQGLVTEGDALLGYSIPNILVDHAVRNPHVPPGFWRGVNINQNAIFMECFMDELAEAAGKDPYEFRRGLMQKHPRHLAVLEAVAERISWSEPPPEGVFRGMAQVMAYASYVAAACEISVQDGNKVKIHRIVAATDCSYAVNPAQIRRQVSGSFVYGLSALFMQQCTVKDGRIEQKNFDTYPSMRIAQMPEVETIIIEGGGDTWGGVGEPTIGVAAPAVLNAIFQATGKRFRSVPLKEHGLQLI